MTHTDPRRPIKNKSAKRMISIMMKKGIVHMVVLRMPKGKYIFVKKDIPPLLDLITFGIVEIIEPFIGNGERRKVLAFLRERYSLWGNRETTMATIPEANTVKFSTAICFALGLLLPLWPITLPLMWWLAYRSYKKGGPEQISLYELERARGLLEAGGFPRRSLKA